MEGPIFGGAYVRREICVSNSIGLACSGKEIYHFCFFLLCIRGQIPSTSPPEGLYSEGRLSGGFFALRFWGADIWRGLYMEGLIFLMIYNISRWRWVGGNKDKACYGKEQAVEVEILVEWSRSSSKTKNS